MKESNDPLRRLFRAAALTAKEMPPAPTAITENRVIAHWRNAGIEDEFDLLAKLLGRAMAFASLIMVLSMGWGWVQSRSESDRETPLTDYAMNIQLPP